MIGRRVPDGTLTNLQPGDYGRVGERWHMCLPNGGSGILGPSHQITEHEDGSITVYPSIQDPETGWHGHLINGEWREVA